MKISILLEREPFGEIFEKTMKRFFTDFYECEYNVKWLGKKQWKSESDKTPGQKWICNPLINSIYVNGAGEEVFDAVKWEYSKNPRRPWRSLLQKIYLHLALKSKIGPLLAQYFVLVSPHVHNAENILIIGGNAKIRVIDNKNKAVFVILKHGFKQKYLEREIRIRQDYGYLPVPPIKQIGTADWYSERLVSGISPDRLGPERGKRALEEIATCMHRLMKDTAREEKISEYANGIIGGIRKKINKINQIPEGQKENILHLASVVIDSLEKHSLYDRGKIYTSITHGDFQAGNMLYDGDKAWILDWEYSRRRQVGNDLFVLISEPRTLTGFARRFLNLYENNIDEIQRSLISNWPLLDWQNENMRKASLKLFLLEEMDFKLEENDNPAFYSQTHGLTSFLNELKHVLNHG